MNFLNFSILHLTAPASERLNCPFKKEVAGKSHRFPKENDSRDAGDARVRRLNAGNQRRLSAAETLKGPRPQRS